LRIVFMGSPGQAVFPLEQLVLNKHQISAVYTRPDKPAGRGRTIMATPVKQAALALNLPVVQVISLKQPEAVSQLASLKPEAIVVAAFGQLLPQAVLDIPCYGCLNIHPSLLPKYRGASPVISTILAGDQFAGVSVMRLDAGMDSGPIFKQAQAPVLVNDTAESLTYRLFRIGAQLLLEVLAELPLAKAIAVPQDGSHATFTKELVREAGKIDWQRPAVEIERMVRAYQPWPEAYTFWQGKQLAIQEAVLLEEGVNLAPGEVSVILPGLLRAAFAVGTGSGRLGVIRVQIAGKKSMSASEFLRGQQNFLGSILG
jgi:methionyl-tRNA formyltransferase